MGNINGNALSQLLRLRDAYRKLEEKNPEHELLSLAILNSRGEFDFSEEYHSRFTNPRDEFGTYSYVRYTRELEAAMTG